MGEHLVLELIWKLLNVCLENKLKAWNWDVVVGR